MSADKYFEEQVPSAGTAGQDHPATDERAIEFGWHTHEAVQGWIESVDIKTSIVLVAEIAVAGAAASSLLTDGGAFRHATGLHLAFAIAAVVALSGAVAASLWVVFPRLGKKGSEAEENGDIIYFGHLRHRSAVEIEDVLKGLTPQSQRWQLSRQLQATGRVAWRKHVWLRRSIGLLALGSLLFVTSLVAFDQPGDLDQQPVRVKLVK